jgi:hypothetical protein
MGTINSAWLDAIFRRGYMPGTVNDVSTWVGVLAFVTGVFRYPPHPSVSGSIGSLPFERGADLQGVCAAWEGHFNAG